MEEFSREKNQSQYAVEVGGADQTGHTLTHNHIQCHWKPSNSLQEVDKRIMQPQNIMPYVKLSNYSNIKSIGRHSQIIGRQL